MSLIILAANANYLNDRKQNNCNFICQNVTFGKMPSTDTKNAIVKIPQFPQSNMFCYLFFQITTLIRSTEIERCPIASVLICSKQLTALNRCRGQIPHAYNTPKKIQCMCCIVRVLLSTAHHWMGRYQSLLLLLTTCLFISF